MTYSPFRHLGSVFWKCRPIQLTLFLTRRCNARCPFCFYLSRPPEAAKHQRELSAAELERIAMSMGSLLWLAFSGGEIFLRDDLVEITRIFYEKNRPAIILFPTNGLLTEKIREQTEMILKQCQKSTIVVKLSLDGQETTHDALRGIRGGFRKTLATYEALGTLLADYPNLELGINTVFCRANQDEMKDLIAFVAGLKMVTTHTVSLVRGEVADDGLKQIDLAKYRDTIDLLAANLGKRAAAHYRFTGAGIKAAQDIFQRRLIYETAWQKKRLVPCYAGRLNLVVTETGDLYPCESFTMKMGNVREEGYDVQRILKGQKAGRTVQAISKQGCYCTHECYMMTNILFNPLLAPPLLREYLHLKFVTT